MKFHKHLTIFLFVSVAFFGDLKMTILAEDVNGNASSDSIVLEIGNSFYDGWKYGEDEYDLPNPPTNDYIDLFFSNNWIGEVDALGNVCEGNQFYSDRKGWSDNSFSKVWDVAGFVVGDADSLKLSVDIESVSGSVSVYLLTPTKTLNILDTTELIMGKEELQVSVAGNELVAPVQILVTNCGGYYCTDIDNTGESQLIIFSDEITSLDVGDEIGVFDSSGIINYNNCENELGEVLVGSVVWSGESNPQGTVGSVSAIGSVDLCALGGVQLPGFVEGNSVLIKVWRPSTQTEYLTDVTFSIGNGVFGDIITSVSSIELKGCTDLDACNYDQGATADDGSCSYIDGDACDCSGSVLDECGVCGGEGIADGACDCDGSIEDCNGDCGGDSDIDCAGVCGGEAYIDLCGVCNADADDDETTCLQDCNNEWGGVATLDDCDVCDSDPGNDNTTCNQDCLGVWGGDAEVDCDGVCQGDAQLDECGVCGGSGPQENFDCSGNCLVETDCSGECGGDLTYDECGVCGGSGPIEACGCNSIPDGACDCEGNVLDECGVCGGDGVPEGFCDCNGNTEDCSGDCAGDAQLDNCGVCQGDNSTCNQDCLGVWGGTATLDDCGVCEGNNITCEQDCLGVWGGSAQDDCFGECNGPAKFDCAGECNGLAEFDECGVCDDDPNNDNQTCLDAGEDSGSSWLTDELPYESAIVNAYPNPFNPSVSIDYHVSRYQDVSIYILDVKGREIERIKEGYQGPGRYKVRWYPSGLVASGVYLVVFKASDSLRMQKITFIR